MQFLSAISLIGGLGGCITKDTAITDNPAAETKLVDAATREGSVIVYSVLSNNAAQPLIDDFQSLYPGITVNYDGEKGSNETDERFRSEIANSKSSADVMWSSSMDLQMKLVAEGYAAKYRSPETSQMPAWTVYDDTAYATTLEPVVIIYNKDLLTGSDIPQNHSDLANIISSAPEHFRAKVTAFDIEKSGVGYMFATQDQRLNPDLPNLLRAFGKVDMQPSPGTGNMLTKVNRGEYLLGYNIMGAYALSRSQKDLPNLGIVYPSDYTLAFSRIAFVSKRAAHPNAARLWLNYMLSRRGQMMLGNAVNLYAIRPDVTAKNTAETLRNMLGDRLKPIPVSMALIDKLKPEKRSAFLDFWSSAIAEGTK